MQYTATGQRRQYFELYNDANEPLGRLNYSVWLSTNADIVLPAGDTYRVGPSNFWLTSMEMTSGDTCIAAAKRGWAMNVVVTLGGVDYHFKGEGLLNRHYVVTTDAGQEIAVLRPNIQWHSFSFTYEIETNDNYRELANPAIVLFLIYCCNYITSGSVGGVF